MGIRLNRGSWMIASVVIAALAFGLERVLEPGGGGALMITMTVFLGLSEGVITLIAAAELSDGHWHLPLLTRAAALCYVIPVGGLLFVANLPQLSIYPWVQSPGVWFNRSFFIARHLVLIALMFLLARRFMTSALRREPRRGMWAVLVVLTFVWHLTMIGIESFMSIERPWYSTLFGAFIVVGAFLSAICVLALIVFPWRNRTDAASKLVQKSIGGLIFGFSIFWAYFYFSQLIVIWFGNLPDETSYLARRIAYHTQYWLPARLIFTLVWGVPFTVLLRRKNKTNAYVTSALGLVVIGGLILQYWLMLVPDCRVSIPGLLIELALMTWLTAGLVRSHEAFAGAQAPVSVEGGSLAPEGH